MTNPFHQYKRVIGFDIETWDGKNKGSLDPFTGKIALVQVAFDDGDIKIFRFNERTKPYIKELLEDPSILKVGHNLKFDLKFLYVNDIYPNELFDTMIASEILYAGISNPDDISQYIEAQKKYLDVPVEELFQIEAKKVTKATRFSHSLIAVLKRELNVNISKDVQNSNWGVENLTPQQIEYAKNDVKYLIKLAKHFWKKIVLDKLEKVFYLESEFVRVLALLELIGVKIDAKGWKEYLTSVEKETLELEKELKKEIYEKFVRSKENKSIISLFEDTAEYEKINLNSPLQMAKIFGLKNVSKLTLQKQDDPTIQKYIEYKKKMKLVTTYTEEYLNKLDDKHRLRSDYSQTRTATGRISSSSPNLQNVPSWFKRYIVAEEGYIPVFADYSQVELRILAYLSGDEEFIKSCEAKDMHSENARKIFKIPEDQPVPKDLRKKAKTVSFAIPYGSSALGLVERGMFETVEEAEMVMREFFNNFPKVREFLQKSADLASKFGFTRDAIGRIRRYETVNFDFYLERFSSVEQKLKQFYLDLKNDIAVYETYDEFIKNYENLKGKFTRTDFKIAKEFLEAKSKISKIRREGQNHPIQATSASITKTAMLDLYHYFLATGYGYMTLTVHDSIFFEVKKDNIFPALKEIKSIMEEAGKKVVPNINTPVDIEVGRKVLRNCVICGQETELNEYIIDWEKEKLYHVDEIGAVCEECQKLSSA